MNASEPRPLWLGLICLVIGVGILGIGLGVVPADPEAVHAPPWVLAACGAVFMLGGLAMLAYNRPRVRSAAGVTIVLAMGLIAAWVSLRGDGDQFSGGLPFVSPEANVILARGVFGLSAAVCLALFVWGASRIARGHTD